MPDVHVYHIYESSITGFSDGIKLKTGAKCKEKPGLFCPNKVYVLFSGFYFLLNIELGYFLNRILKQIVGGFLPPNFSHLFEESTLETLHRIQNV